MTSQDLFRSTRQFGQFCYRFESAGEEEYIVIDPVYGKTFDSSNAIILRQYYYENCPLGRIIARDRIEMKHDLVGCMEERDARKYAECRVEQFPST